MSSPSELPESPPATPMMMPDLFPNNPGTVEDLHRKCQSVFPMFFEGGKVLMNVGLSNHFQVSHTIALSNAQPAGYRFGATFLGSNQLSPSEVYPLLMADCSLFSGSLNANVVHSFTKRLRCKFMTQIDQSKWQSTQVTTDYRGDLYTASLTLGNPDLIHGSGVAVFHYLRAVTKSLSLGAELAYQASPQLPGGHVAVAAVAARYATPDYAAALTMGNSGQLHATVYQKCSDNLQMGVELETNYKMQESTASIGYEVTLDKGGFKLAGSVDTDFIVKSTVEKKLSDSLPFTLALCSLINHRKNSYQFGCGLILF